MEIFNSKGNTQVSGKTLNAQFVKVYFWMFFGLMLTGAASYLSLYSGITLRLGMPGILLLFLGEVALVWSLSRNAINMEYSKACLLFAAYSILNGVTISSIFYLYTTASITFAFLVAAAFFGCMSIYGLVTKSDLSSLSSLLFMGLIGIIIASVVNMFLQSSGFAWILSFAAVALFLGLTAYDSQRIKELSYSFTGTPRERNVAILGALILYLDFINLFLYILRILGKRRD